MLNICSLEIMKNLRSVFVINCFTCFQLNNQGSIYNEICKIISDNGTIFIMDRDGVLLYNV